MDIVICAFKINPLVFREHGKLAHEVEKAAFWKLNILASKREARGGSRCRSIRAYIERDSVLEIAG